MAFRTSVDEFNGLAGALANATNPRGVDARPSNNRSWNQIEWRFLNCGIGDEIDLSRRRKCSSLDRLLILEAKQV
jgi:hypothetical protein